MKRCVRKNIARHYRYPTAFTEPVQYFPPALEKVDEGFQLQQRGLEKTVLDFIRARIREKVARHEQITKCDDRYTYRRLGDTSTSRAGAGNLATGNHRQGAAGGVAIAHPFAGAGPATAAASSTIDTLLRSQTRPTSPLVAADWQAVLRHVYKGAATADAKTVGFLVKDAISRKQSGKRGPGNSGPGTRKGGVGAVGAVGAGQGQSSVPYGLLLQVLLGYQLHRHLRRLEAFAEDFREASTAHHKINDFSILGRTNFRASFPSIVNEGTFRTRYRAQKQKASQLSR